jgi:NRPS condensation-like uncharacterized protein
VRRSRSIDGRLQSEVFVPSTSRIPAQPQDAFNDFARVVADQQLGIVLELSGALDTDRLARAVADLIDAQPVLGCCYFSEGRRAWHEPVPDAPVQALGAISAADVWQAAVAAAGQPLDAEAPHLAVTHVRGEDHDAIGVRIDHTAADGQGAKACAELLAAAFSGSGGGSPSDARSASLAVPGGASAAALVQPDRSWRRLRRAAGLPRMIDCALSHKELPPTWGLPSAGNAPGRRRHHLVTLPAEEFSAKREWGKVHGFTVNDMIVAAFYRAMFSTLETPDDSPMVVRVSFDQRRYLPASDAMPSACNLSSVEPLALARTHGEAFEATVARVNAKMQRLKASSPGLGNALLLEVLFRLKGCEATRRDMVAQMERGQRAGRSYLFVSNFGVLDAERLSFGDAAPTRAVMLPVAGHPPFAMLGASSFLGELTISMGFAEAETDAAVPMRILSAMASDLAG